MSLFTTIPEHFFSILASKNKDIYAMALVVLYNSLQTDELSIKKEDYLRTLKDKATNLVLALEDDDENGEEDNPISSQTLPSKAALIVRRLEETGWIDIEIDPDNFEEYIALPSYSIQFLTLINSLVTDAEAEYVSLVHSTYTELKMEDIERDEFMYATLLRAYENTRKLRVELVTLGHSIRLFQNRLGRVFSTNSILADYFDEYKERVSDRYYHPLKTFDSVAKFKRPIISMMQKWLRDDEIRSQLVAQSIVWNRKKSKEEAELDLIAKMNYISDMYETISDMISDIDTKHQDYTKASASKILYLNNTDKTIKGHLDTIFKHYAQAAVEGDGLRPIVNRMQEAVVFFEQGYINPDSITLPIIRQYRQEGEPLEIVDYGDVADMLMRGFLDEARNSFTDDRIYAFMETAFGDESELPIGEIALPDFDAFLLLILASLKTNDDRCFYSIDMEEGQIISQGYSLPNFTFKRKELVA
jgi:hypothetical protein